MTEDEARELATVLHRAILKREADPAWIDALAHALATDSSPAAIIQQVRNLNRSGEGRIVAARARGAFVSERPSPIGPINHIISLGTICYASWIIKQLGLKRASYPFDWTFSSPAMVLDVLRDDFARFLDPVYYRVNPPERRASLHEGIAEHLWYREHFGVENVFSHRDVTAPAHRAYYQRAVDRFRRVIASDETKLLVMISPGDRHATNDDFSGLCAWLDEHGRNAMLLAVNVGRVEHNDAARTGGRIVAVSGHHQFVRYDASSPLLGLQFINWLDDVNLRAMVSQYERNLDADQAEPNASM